MVIVPTSFTKNRLRTILAYKFIDVAYVIPSPSTKVTLFFPIDANYCQFINFKLSSNLVGIQKFNYLSVCTNLAKQDVLCNDTVLWYENVDRGQIFDTKLQAFSVNNKYARPDDLKPYFTSSNLEGLYIYIDASHPISNVEAYAIYEDLDCMR